MSDGGLANILGATLGAVIVLKAADVLLSEKDKKKHSKGKLKKVI
jgi:hypothetical protein